MLQLARSFQERLQQGLSRKSITEPSRWATKYRIMSGDYPGPWNFKHHPWLKDMHDSKFDVNIGQKSAQMGFTEWALNMCFYYIDVPKMDVLYILPNKVPDAADFSSGRFNKALDLSPYLKTIFSDTDNIGHKRAGFANLYVRGSNSRSQLKSIPVNLIVFDELDEMNQQNLPLAEKRTSGQKTAKHIKISTPTDEDYGINAAFNLSTQNHFFFPCPACGKWIELKYDATNTQSSLVIIGENLNDPRIAETYLQCYECKNKLHHEGKVDFLNKGKWVPKHPTNLEAGWHINQMYSMHLPLKKIAEDYFKAQVDEFADLEFWNSTLGLTRTATDAKLTLEHLNNVRKNYKMYDGYTGEKVITLGCDVGKVLHIVIDEWTINGRQGNDVSSYSKRRNIWHGERLHFEDLDELMRNYRVHYAVVDAQPETRKAFEFVNRFYGIARMCRYTQGLTGRGMGKSDDNPDTMIHVDRTSWLDLTLSRYRNGSVEMPIDTKFEFTEHMKAPARRKKRDNYGNIKAIYQTPENKADHFAHASNYSEIALPLSLGIGPNVDLKEDI
jgi:hypothetical protein